MYNFPLKRDDTKHLLVILVLVATAFSSPFIPIILWKLEYHVCVSKHTNTWARSSKRIIRGWFLHVSFHRKEIYVNNADIPRWYWCWKFDMYKDIFRSARKCKRTPGKIQFHIMLLIIIGQSIHQYIWNDILIFMLESICPKRHSVISQRLCMTYVKIL